MLKPRRPAALTATIAALRREEATAPTEQEREQVLSRWEAETAEANVQARDEESLERQRETVAAVGLPTDAAPLAVPSSDAASSSPPAYSEQSPASSSRPPPLPARQSSDDERFQRDLDLAMQLSLAEQRGYERGLAHSRPT